MPAGQRRQSNALLYTLITFVALFIVATIASVIFYVNFEEQKDIAQSSQEKLEEFVSRTELQKIGSIVGAKQRGQSTLATMVGYLDRMVCLIIGGVPEETSAEEKVNTADRKVSETLKKVAGTCIDIADSNTVGLVRIIETLKTAIDNLTDMQSSLKAQLDELQQQFDDTVAVGFEREQALLAEKEKYQQQVNRIKKDYDELKGLLEQSSEQRIGNLMAQLNERELDRDQLREDLLKTQAELRQAETKMELALKQLHEVKPLPSIDVAAFKPDGKVMLINAQTGIVHLNLGSRDRIYRGLTFSVYDKNLPFPKDGKPKAEIEVFDIQEDISMARIIRSEINKPILEGDIAANLIWDRDKTNVFVIAGEFDINNDGQIDIDASEKIKKLIEQWGGEVADSVSMKTDFAVLGSAPKVLKKPTYEEIEIYPDALEKYEDSIFKRERYEQVMERAQSLSVPIFNIERFLYFVGYKTYSAQNDAF